jgi:hypothetical protein
MQVTRERRTRSHQIADLAVNHVERIVLLAGFSAQRIVHDYGVDLLVTTYRRNGEVEGGYLYFQCKA